MTPSGKVAFLVAALLGLFGLRADPIRHDFVAIDEGLGNLLRVDETNAAHNWRVPIGHAHPRDLQLVGNGLLLVSHDVGFAEYELATGRRVLDLIGYANVSSARRLADGHTLIAYALDKAPLGVFVAEVDANGKALRKTTYPGDYVRLMRQTPSGTFLFGMNDKIQEGDGKGNFIWTAAVPGFRHAWKALRLPNGHTIAAGGYGGFMVEFGAKGELIRRFGGAGQVPAAVHPYFYAMFQILSNGDIVAANWQGHGPGHGNSGLQIVEFDSKGGIVWQWSDRAIISSIQAVLVLDGLDTGLLHDERNGVMQPLRQEPALP